MTANPDRKLDAHRRVHAVTVLYVRLTALRTIQLSTGHR